MKGFLRVFQSILHALEAAAAIAAPIVKAVDPEVGALMNQAAATAVVVEALVTAPGVTKAGIVSEATQAGIDLTNSLLKSQGKPALPSGIADAIAGSTKLVVDTLNSVANTVTAAPKVAAAAVSGQQSTTSILDAK